MKKLKKPTSNRSEAIYAVKFYGFVAFGSNPGYEPGGHSAKTCGGAACKKGSKCNCR